VVLSLQDLAIANDKGTLVLDGIATTYRYLDEEEIARQRKAAKDAKDKGAK